MKFKRKVSYKILATFGSGDVEQLISEIERLDFEKFEKLKALGRKLKELQPIDITKEIEEPE